MGGVIVDSLVDARANKHSRQVIWGIETGACCETIGILLVVRRVVIIARH